MMDATKMKQHESANKENESTLKGTFFSLGVVGLVIFVTYLVLYGLFMARL